MALTFIDLFAGVGGFHQALSAFGFRCTFASEIDKRAQAVYLANHGESLDGPLVGDLIPLSEDRVDNVIPTHDILTAGFPCQPFSKSGRQAGVNEARGTLFFNIARVIEARRPNLVILENVRNIAGPRHTNTWQTIHAILSGLGYHVNARPVILSPHRLSPEHGGTPQFRERVFIVAIKAKNSAVGEHAVPDILQNRPTGDWRPARWRLQRDLLLPRRSIQNPQQYDLDEGEVEALETWDAFTQAWRRGGRESLPGFPLWTEFWDTAAVEAPDTPEWKRILIRKNRRFAKDNRDVIAKWRSDFAASLLGLPPSQLKYEWQANDIPSLWRGLIQFRPSGIRVRPATYTPALVALNQTPIVGPKRRRLAVEEAALLQGLPSTFSFAGQPMSESYKQLGNAVAVGVVQHLLIQLALREPRLLASISSAILEGAARAGIEAAPVWYDS